MLRNAITVNPEVTVPEAEYDGDRIFDDGR
jgi:hypothetical protein